MAGLIQLIPLTPSITVTLDFWLEKGLVELEFWLAKELEELVFWLVKELVELVFGWWRS